MSSKTVVVLGVARSGTSMVSGLLHLIGVKMHQHHNPSFDNPRGSFEDIHFLSITTKLVAGTITTGEAIKRIRKIVHKRGPENIWGFKSALTHHNSHIVIPQLQNPHLIYTSRNPIDNMRSFISHRARKGVKQIPSMIYAGTSVCNSLKKLATMMEDFKCTPNMETRYEWIRNNPVVEARRMAEFLGIDFNDEWEKKIKRFIISDYSSIGKMSGAGFSEDEFNESSKISIQ